MVVALEVPGLVALPDGAAKLKYKEQTVHEEFTRRPVYPERYASVSSTAPASRPVGRPQQALPIRAQVPDKTFYEAFLALSYLATDYLKLSQIGRAHV